MAKISDLRRVFRSYIGIKENPPYSNNVIFNTVYYGRPVSGSDYPWCAVAMWSGFRDAKAPDLFYGGGRCASCGELMRYAKAHGQWVTSGYRPGDLPIYDFENDGNVDTDHIGWIDQVLPDGKLVVLEGNTSIEGDDGSQSDGGAFAERRRNTYCIIGAIRPNYEPESAEVKPIPTSLLKIGSKGAEVVNLQKRLNERGFSCGAVDGDFGPKTDKAVKAFQAANKLEQDGEVGPLTWAALYK